MIFGGWQYFNGNGRMISIRKRRMVPAPMKDSSCRFREFPIPGVLFIEDGILVSTATQACQKIDSHMPCATETQSPSNLRKQRTSASRGYLAAEVHFHIA